MPGGPDRDGSFSLDIDEADQDPDAKFMSIILTNLQINYDGWKAELPKEEEEEEEVKENIEVKDDNVSYIFIDHYTTHTVHMCSILCVGGRGVSIRS